MTNCGTIINKAIESGCKVLLNEPLKNHTTFKVGGECDAMISINSSDNLIELVRLCSINRVPYLVIGKGSNLIVSDEGFNGIVLLMGNDFSDIYMLDDTTISCSSGTSLSSLCLFALEHSLSGLEFAWGIPGSVGGAVYMNAGAYGGEISDAIISAEYVDDAFNLSEFKKAELNMSYRHSVFSDNNFIITKAVFKLNKGNRSDIKSRMDELLKRRKDKQPLEFPSAGSTFKRPQGSFASLLIEQCGLKGLSVGGAKVSEKHSGFIINVGNATSKDILELIEIVRQRVQEQTGFILECEPKIISN